MLKHLLNNDNSNVVMFEGVSFKWNIIEQNQHLVHCCNVWYAEVYILSCPLWHEGAKK